MHSNRRDHIVGLAKEKLALMTNTSVGSVVKKLQTVEPPELPKPKAPAKQPAPQTAPQEEPPKA